MTLSLPLCGLFYEVEEKNWDSVFQTDCEAWLLSEPIGFERVGGVTQLFALRHRNSNVRMLCAKVTNDFLFSGCAQDLTWFESVIRQRFNVGTTILSGQMNFNGAILEQTESGDITLSMEVYMERAQAVSVDRERRKNQ